MDLIREIRNQLLLLKAVVRFTEICESESIASRSTVFDALNPTLFRIERQNHRAIARAALRFLQSEGKMQYVVIDDVMPEGLPVTIS